MSHPGAKSVTRYRQRALLISLLAGLPAIAFVVGVHPFLATNSRVAADILVVEGWVPAYVLDAAVKESRSSSYSHIFVSGLEAERGAEGEATTAARHLIAGGVSATKVIAVSAAPVNFNRTSHMARAIRDRMRALGIQPSGVNVMTLGPHGRQSRLAYQRMLGPKIPVGVITIPKNDYEPARWWASSAGIKKTLKDFAGWLKEALFGLRS